MAENLAALATSQPSPMVIEGDLVVATESRHGDQLADVLRAIAEGRTKHNEIADAVGTDPSRPSATFRHCGWSSGCGR